MEEGHLVLSRRVGESIQAGNMLITILGITAGKVRIGFRAPKDIPITRTELLETDSCKSQQST
jgi:carbon storage regulator CsrA